MPRIYLSSAAAAAKSGSRKIDSKVKKKFSFYRFPQLAILLFRTEEEKKKETSREEDKYKYYTSQSHGTEKRERRRRKV